jgi:hypothetical protein
MLRQRTRILLSKPYKLYHVYALLRVENHSSIYLSRYPLLSEYRALIQMLAEGLKSRIVLNESSSHYNLELKSLIIY